jgi:hypothetical protein
VVRPSPLGWSDGIKEGSIVKRDRLGGGPGWTAVLLAGVLAILWGGAAAAVPIGGTLPNLDPPFDSVPVTADVDFSFDAGCTVDCQLHITLANITTGQLGTIGQTLTGITFEPNSSITIDRSQSTVLVDTSLGDALVGAGSVVATADLISGSHIDVTRHWGFDLLAEPVMQAGGARMLGSYVVSSVGDVVNNIGLLGNKDLFTSGSISSVEPNPPNGTEFSIVNGATCSPGSCGGLDGGFQDQQGRAWIQSRVWISLHYDGQLTSISKVEPIFGTDGNPSFVVPEPGALLLPLGLAAFVWSRDRRRLREP